MRKYTFYTKEMTLFIEDLLSQEKGSNFYIDGNQVVIKFLGSRNKVMKNIKSYLREVK
jgi:hypothetical protein